MTKIATKAKSASIKFNKPVKTKVSKQSKMVPLSSIVDDYLKNPAIQAQIEQIKKERELSPARHAKKFNVELMNLSMEINFYSQQIGWLHTQFMNSEGSDDSDEIYDARRKAIFALASAQNKYDALVRELDLDIHNEDAQKA